MANFSISSPANLSSNVLVASSNIARDNGLVFTYAATSPDPASFVGNKTASISYLPSYSFAVNKPTEVVKLNVRPTSGQLWPRRR